MFDYKLNHHWKNGRVERKPAGKESQRIQEALFHEKKFLIENCLFGVDINPNSVKICRLRLWIELLKHAYYTSGPQEIPDQVRDDNNEEALSPYSELEVLPNIDINIKQGNSLVSRFGLDEDLSSIFKKSEHSLHDYKQAVRNYRETRDRNEKQRLQTLIDDIKAEYSENLLNNKPINKKLSKARGKLELMQNEDLFGEGKATKKELKKQEKKVTKLEEQKAEEEAGAFYREAFEWRFEFPEVLDEDGKYTGFDVVIGNPPYVRQEALGDIKPFLKTHFEVYAGTADLYAYFIEQGVKLNKENGYFHYIVANKWMRANYGKPLRTWLQQKQITAITDFGDLPVFEEATTYPCLLEIKKSDNPTVFKALEVENLPVEDFDVLEEENGFEVDANKLSEEGWSLVPLKTQKLLEKLRKAGTPLGEYVNGKIHYGIKTGYNKAFVIDEETKDRLIDEDASSAEIIKPFLAGRDIKRYQQPDQENYLIFTRRGTDLDKYPAIKKYLEGFKKELEPRPKDVPSEDWPGRKPGTYQWYEIQDGVDYYKEFEKPKIIYAEIATRGQFMIDEDNMYVDTTSFILGNSSYNLLGVLNSKLWTFMFSQISSEIRGGYYRWKSQYLEVMPLPKVLDDSNEIGSLVNQILTAKKENPEADTGALEAEIDQLVYQLYGLTEEEIAIVEESVG
ncbi:MAG: Eco57I restriction-modification methylase domain-containing protein [Gracilimonas sp.]|uniref:Eco57I restriction-modification methylase domain-containing protein n=1 Tax=Gracilimonas sp. TaxID=1974203 RepID=UPI001B17472A|nr:TaqI-like C-terminal specificity domain-containing protein [Gracilimonas sp.]MBO6586049.1 Eco57I restriction-modification methylase domain-containing protein [Gracilimonas sp.]MBO6617046.1 Eco57I restriction-modification methylase domain-containing protein [Gracilimonas sp.]